MSDRADLLYRRLRVRHLQLIVTLSQTRSVRGAATQLHLSQPAVSKMLQEVEDAFGEPLFIRSRRGVDLLPMGQIALRRAQVVLHELRSAALEFDAGRHSGLLRLGTLPVLDLLPAAIVALLAEFPDVSVQLNEAGVQPLITMLLDGALDCVCAALPPDQLDRVDELEVEPIAGDRLYGLVSPRHPLANRRTLDWASLQHLRWVTNMRKSMIRQVFEAAFVQRGLVPPRPVVETQSPITLNTLVAQDPSLIGLARYEAVRLARRTEKLVMIELQPAVELPALCLITRRDVPAISPALDAFRAHVRRLAKQSGSPRKSRVARSSAQTDR
ncbi:MAG: hypothetical protein RL322_2850 [Pseudomonadota bacterium]|jgi:DNA-binding transcriptional LysR family regulator